MSFPENGLCVTPQNSPIDYWMTFPVKRSQNPHKAKGWTPPEILSNAVLFILASFETTASVLQFLIYELAKNPQFQENILREIEKMEKISYETIRDFKYLDAVIKETMRSVSK